MKNNINIEMSAKEIEKNLDGWFDIRLKNTNAIEELIKHDNLNFDQSVMVKNFIVSSIVVAAHDYMLKLLAYHF